MIYCLSNMVQSRMCSHLPKWDWKIVLTFLVILIAQVNCALGCSALMQNGIGYITPDGEIIKAVGSELVLDCVVNDTVASSKDLIWRFKSTILDDSLTEVIDNVTKRLIIPNTEMSDSGIYYCVQQKREGNETRVCLVEVKIGVPPLQVENFECIAMHLKYMVCKWDKPNNPVQTNYSLFYYRAGSYPVTPCDVIKIGNQLGCNFTNFGNGNPYASYEKEFIFNLTAYNAFGRKTMQFHVDHYSVVIPAPPYSVKFHFGNGRSGTVTWKTNKHMYGFENLHYQVAYRTEFDAPEDWTIVDLLHNSSKEPKEFHFNNMIPNANYTVRLTCVSGAANRSDPFFWSEPYYISRKTHPDVPESPPRVILGSFHVKQHVENRSALIFWKNIEKYEKNGLDFHYLWKLEDEETGEEFNESLGGKGFASYTTLKTDRAYNFTIYSVNRVGESKNKTYLRIEAHKNMPQVPAKLTVVAFGQGVYNVSWKPATNETMDIVTYTVYWCHGVSNYDNRCEGDIRWNVVGSDVTSVNITVFDDRSRYRFAVSAENSQGTSSGMYWNTCIVSKEQTMGKMKDVNIKDVSATSFTVYWNLNCIEKLGILTGFAIWYCPVERPQSTDCIGPAVHKEVNDPDAVSKMITDLDVYTTYQVSIAANTVAGKGESSDFLYLHTLEGVPSDVESITIDYVLNTSFVVHWKHPKKPNGIIRNYTIHYNYKKITVGADFANESQYFVDGLDPFTNYTVYVTSCTNAGCSDRRTPSIVTTIQTKVGVPGQMEPPRIKHINDTFIAIDPEFNSKPSGPDNLWDLQYIWLDETNNSPPQLLSNLSNMHYFAIQCANPENLKRVYEIQTRAVNYDGFNRLEGKFSEPSKVPCRFTSDMPVGAYVGITLGIAAFLVILGVISYKANNCVRVKVQEVFFFKPKLPSGLRSPQQSKDNDYGVFKKELEARKTPDSNKGYNGALTKLLSDQSAPDVDYRNRNISGDSTMSAKSADELLLRNYPKGCPDHDSSLNSSGQDSVSTGHTTCTDEGSVPNTPTPESPDSSSTVKADDLKAITVIPQYTTFDHYLDDEKKQGYSCVSDAPPASLGYVARQASPEVPSYSKFGTMYDPEESMDGPSYSKFGLALPIGDQDPPWLDPIALDSPKSFAEAEFDADFATPYSCLGNRFMPGPSGYISMEKVSDDAKVHGSNGEYIPQEAIGPYCQVSEMNTQYPLPIPTLAEVEEPRVVFSDSPRRTLAGVPSVSGNYPIFDEDLVDGPRPKSSLLSSYGHFSPEHQRFSTISSSSEV